MTVYNFYCLSSEKQKSFTLTDFTKDNFESEEEGFVENRAFVSAKIKTENGERIVFEWINTDSDGDETVERTDSNLRINEIQALTEIFDISKKPSLMPACDFIPLDEIFDALDSELSKA